MAGLPISPWAPFDGGPRTLRGIEWHILEAHIGDMRVSDLRRIVHLFVVLALATGLYMSAMPVASAATHTGATIVTGDRKADSECNGCSQLAMAADDCLAVCGPVSLLAPPPGIAYPLDGRGLGLWAVEKLTTAGVQPDLTPPRP